MQRNLGGACKFMAIGLVALYGLNELVYRPTRLVVSNQTNLKRHHHLRPDRGRAPP
ncbi:MAG: hypothetical protein ACLTG0_09190 [Oscillibacter sp.]